MSSAAGAPSRRLELRIKSFVCSGSLAAWGALQCERHSAQRLELCIKTLQWELHASALRLTLALRLEFCHGGRRSSESSAAKAR